MARRLSFPHTPPSDVDPDCDYGGECRLFNVETGRTHGPFWVDLEFAKHNGSASAAVVQAPHSLAAEIVDVGARAVLVLADGREVNAYVRTVLKQKIILSL